MKPIQCVLLSVSLLSHAVFAAPENYLQRFEAYTQWSQNLPDSPSPEFITFINSDQPLSIKLREKWLHTLGKNKRWDEYSRYYRPSQNIALQCYALTAEHERGSPDALNGAKPLWLNGKSQPDACNWLFEKLLKQGDDSLITQRLTLALEQRNLGLANYLLKQYKTPKLQEVKTLTAIYQNPERIKQLEQSPLHREFYLYGLKRMVSINMDKAVVYWKHAKTNALLDERQQQSFLAHLALYKAMRDRPDAPYWFAQVKPQFRNDVLADWQIRFALKHQHWKTVEQLIEQKEDKDTNLSLQYWLARAKAERGEKEQARQIYLKLANTRNYYGFLASLNLKKPLQFQQELPNQNSDTLTAYAPLLAQMKARYTTHQTDVSRQLNDFMLELSKDEQSALANWVAQELQWYGKAIQLSNTDTLNNQLALRFPTAYANLVAQNAKKYNLPPHLIYAVIRQESMFRPDIVSPAGAHGLMQVMPATAKMVAKQEKIPLSDTKELFLPSKNIAIGSAYLKQMSQQFNQHPILMTAAYNAGPQRATYWLKHHHVKPLDLWIETLPWHETRNYLKNILSFYAVYQHQTQQKPDLSAFMVQF